MDHINRSQLAELEDLLADNLTAWQGEENSVKEEHEELIERLEAFDLSKVFVIPKPEPPFRKMVCSACGSEDVLRDAYASWNQETQEWELMNVYDYAICTSEQCDGSETRIEEKEISDDRPVQSDPV